MADPLSIAASCIGLLGAIAAVTTRINGFVRSVRDARSDLYAVERELGSLRTILGLIQADADNSHKHLPETIVQHLCEVLSNCNGAVADIEPVLAKYEKSGVMTSGRWVLSGKADVEKLKAHLEAHTSALSLVLDMMNLVVAIKVRQDTSTIRDQTSDIKLDTANILEKIDQLQARLPQLGVEERDDFMLQRYLEEMTTYTEGVLSSAQYAEDQEGGLEADNAEMEALEAFLNDPTTEKESTPSASTPSSAADDQAKPSASQNSSISPPAIRLGKNVLFSGNLVIDIPLLPAVLDRVPHGEKDEFTHVRYTAVTCEPRSFPSEGYQLRTSLFTRPRKTAILFSILCNGGSPAQPAQDTIFPSVLLKAWDAIDYLYQSRPGKAPVLGDEGWKRVILHLHFSSRPCGLTASYLDSISARPIQWDDSGPWSSNRAWGTAQFDEKDMVNGKQVLWHMYESSTQLRLQPAPSTGPSLRGLFSRVPPVYTTGRPRPPIQTIVTHGPGKQQANNDGRLDWKWWGYALGDLLKPRVIAQAESETDARYLAQDILARAWEQRQPDYKPGGNYVEISALREWWDRWSDIKSMVSAS